MSFDTRKSFSDKAGLPQTQDKIQNWAGRRVHVAIEGVIGVGKTSLTRLLQERWACQALLEGYEQNPFLTRGFYDDQKTHGFNTEIFFLLTRFRQQEELQRSSRSVISDYLFQKNWIFAQMNLTGLDLDIYRITYDNFSKQVIKPDLVVLLEADLETVLRRIYFRDREFERSLSPAYLERLQTSYYQYFSSFSESPLLRINTQGLDFVKDPADFAKIAENIEERLRGQKQLSLKEIQPLQREIHV